MAEEPLAQASAPMLRSDSQDKPLDAHRDINHRRNRFARLSRLASPTGQLCLAYLIYILCPGLYWNIFSTIPFFEETMGYALADTSSNVRAAEYALPAVVGLLSGILINKLGPKYSLLVGCVGYPLKVAAYLCYDYTSNKGFVAFAGIVLTISQGISGSVVPYLMLAYPTENSKGRAIAWFLGLWSLCALIGASISLSWTFNLTQLGYYKTYDKRGRPRGDILYAPFLILAVLGTCLCWSIRDIRRGRRGSMSSNVARRPGTWSNLMLELWRDIFANPHMLSLLPMFFVSTWFYGYQFAKANSNIQFTQRAQALNLILYWVMSIVTSVTFGAALDTLRICRKNRARFAWLALLILTIPIWSGGSEFQARNDSYINKFLLEGEYDPPLDPGRASYWGPAVLFLFYGMHSAAWQVASYWIMGALTEDSRRLANYTGAYNAAQSAGNAVIWRLVSPGAYIVGFAYPSTRAVFDAVWALTIASLLIAAPTFFLGVGDVTPPDQQHFESCQSVQGEAEAVALPAEDVAVKTEIAAVALPRRAARRISTASRPMVSKFVACIVYTLVSVIVLLPVGLATLGTLVNTGGSDGCLPDGTFAIPGNFDIWNPQYILTLTVGFGRMSFAIAKFVDLTWDVIVGHGGQALLIWIVYKVLTQYLVCLMEHDGVTTRTYTAVAFHTGSIEGAWMLMRDLATRKNFAIPQNLAMMVYVGVYLLLFPAIISAMTSYAPIGNAYVTFENISGDGSTMITRPFWEFTLVNGTNGTWTYQNITNFTTAAIQDQAHCTQTNSYRWGFSYLMLFILAVASSVFVALLVLLKHHDGLVSSVYQTDCYTPGLWRSVMDLSSHARSVINEDTEHLRTEELEQKLNDTCMAFDKDDLAAVQSAAATAQNSLDSVWRRRKRSKGFDGYESLPAQYEGV